MWNRLVKCCFLYFCDMVDAGMSSTMSGHWNLSASQTSVSE